MIYEFKSRATGTVVSTQDVAERILRIIGKSVQAKGVILPEQMPAAMNALKAAIDSEAKLQPQPQPQSKARDKTQGTAPANPSAPGSGRSEDDGESDAPSVSLKQRAFPFLEMLRDAHSAGKEITWGV
jgi:Domain of unknown function (DUF1840)